MHARKEPRARHLDRGHLARHRHLAAKPLEPLDPPERAKPLDLIAAPPQVEAPQEGL